MIDDNPDEQKIIQRITFWGTKELKDLLKRASELSDLTISQILRKGGKEEALRLIEMKLRADTRQDALKLVDKEKPKKIRPNQPEP